MAVYWTVLMAFARNFIVKCFRNWVVNKPFYIGNILRKDSSIKSNSISMVFLTSRALVLLFCSLSYPESLKK